MRAWRKQLLRALVIGVGMTGGIASALLLAGTATSQPASPFPGSWTISNGKIVDTETNQSGSYVYYFYLVLPAGAVISGPSAEGYSCTVGQPSPPGGQNVVECAGTWSPGAQVVLTMSVSGMEGTPTFQKYVSFDSHTYAGPYDVPPGGTSTTTTTSSSSTSTSTTTNPPPPPRCHCTRLTAQAKEFGFHHEGEPNAPRGGPVTMYFIVHWTMNCFPPNGAGGCAGDIKVDPPRGHNIAVSISQTKVRNCRSCPEHFTTPKPGVHLVCPGHCGRAAAGDARVRLVGDNSLDAASIANKDLVFVLELSCPTGRKPTREKIVFHFGPHGRFVPAKSKLGG